MTATSAIAAMSEFDRVVTDLLAPHDLRYTPGRRALVAALRAGDRLSDVAADVGFVPTGHIIDVYGLCADRR